MVRFESSDTEFLAISDELRAAPGIEAKARVIIDATELSDLQHSAMLREAKKILGQDDYDLLVKRVAELEPKEPKPSEPI